MYRRTTRASLLALSLVVLAGCSSGSATTDSKATGSEATAESSSGAGHGAIEGAAEVAEPQLHLVGIDAEGKAAMLDLLNGTETSLSSVAPAEKVSTDGRYVFAADETGVNIIDSGVWTWDHTDHFHYYRAEARSLERVPGEGVATISTGMLSTAGATGLFFPTSGEAVLLDNKSLSEGKINETLRLKGTPHAGLIAPLGKGAVVSEAEAGQPESSQKASKLNAVDPEGKTLESIDCAEPAGTITTRVALVIGCQDGAVLATSEGEKPVLEKISYPDEGGAPATRFEARKGRPTVAGIGDGKGIWLLDTRERSWEWLETETPVVAATAVDDADEHVVAVGEDGTVQVYDAQSGKQLAATEPLLAATLADQDRAANVSISVDGQRAYVNAAATEDNTAEGRVYEIDYADQARVARELELPVKPVHLAETGR
ncbi:hypothetical protein [Kineosporia babensis]|uniref:ABC transporter n=1 Tax=Kineosporia babensis TaxID=499548 RepID=A0A9X1NDG7_9ACTN|nr:hypothetical protein [Kineosporia babensis]MCD5311028.1 hypothetical protein [Kineosporia babensis]